MPWVSVLVILPEAFAQTGSVVRVWSRNMRWEKIECSFPPAFIVCPQTSEGRYLCSLENLPLTMWPWSQSWRNLLRTWPCVSEPIVTSPEPTASSPTTSMARIMSYSFLKTELESTVYTLEKPKLLLELPRSSPAQCTSVPAGSLPQASLNSGSTGSHWWKGAWNKVILWELTPRLSWGKSRIPMEEGLKEPVLYGRDWGFIHVGLCPGPEEILLVYQGSSLINPTILDWQALKYETKGYVIVKPMVWGWGLESTKALEKCNNQYPRVLLKATGH